MALSHNELKFDKLNADSVVKSFISSLPSIVLILQLRIPKNQMFANKP